MIEHLLEKFEDVFQPISSEEKLKRWDASYDVFVHNCLRTLERSLDKIIIDWILSIESLTVGDAPFELKKNMLKE